MSPVAWFIEIPIGPALTDWVRENRDTFYINHLDGQLCFIGPLPNDAMRQLSDLFPEHKAKIALAAVRSAAAQRQLLEEPRSFSDEDFGRKISVQLVNFYHDLENQFHHLFQYLNPIKEHAFGKPIDTIPAFIVVRRPIASFGPCRG